MRRLLCLLALAAAAAAAPKPVRVPEVVDLRNAKDPVTGGKVVLGRSLDWRGVRVHFEGDASAAQFEKEPAKYLGKLKLKLAGKVVSLENAKCPVTGKPARKEVPLDRGGVRLYLSAPEHAAAFAKDPAKYFGALGYGYVPSVVDLRNTRCPVTGDQCYPEAPIWIDVDGIRIRVCCDHCVKEVEADPKRTFQAMMVDPEKLKKSVK